MDSPAYSARATPPMWGVWVLIPVTGLMTWMTFEATTARFESYADGRSGAAGALGALPVSIRALFFGACALVCIAAIAAQLFRRFARQVEASADANAITSRLFWGPGTLRWDAIDSLLIRGMWLYVHGTDETGRKRRLIFDLAGLEGGPDRLLATIESHRPDLLSRTR